MPKISTSRFGEIEVNDEQILQFPEGLPGFPSIKKFFLWGPLEQPIKWLQAVDNGELALPVADPFVILPTYDVDIPNPDIESLEIKNDKDVGILVVLVIPGGNPLDMTANLRAPLVINTRNRKAKQVIITNEEYPVRYPVFGPETKKALKEKNESSRASVGR